MGVHGVRTDLRHSEMYTHHTNTQAKTAAGASRKGKEGKLELAAKGHEQKTSSKHRRIIRAGCLTTPCKVDTGWLVPKQMKAKETRGGNVDSVR